MGVNQKIMIPEAKSGGRHTHLSMRGQYSMPSLWNQRWEPMAYVAHQFPKWQSVYHYLREWKLQGGWVRHQDKRS